MLKWKKFFVWLMSIFILGISVSAALAKDSSYGLESARTKADYSQSSVFSIVNSIINVFLGAIAIVFFAYTFYAGLRWLSARGEEELINRAKGTLRSSITGLIIITTAYALTNFIFSKFSK